jgi:cyclopropane fatty-acyl-phospholipid synthase-like methyltransferase
MATVTAIPTTERGTAPTVRVCYDLLTVMPFCGLTDLTEGKYVDHHNDPAAYLAAQARQAEYLLDQARCGPGTRLLDIGCGYGRILEQAARRGARAVGITISPPQVQKCREQGLTVHELNYRSIFDLNVGWAPPTNKAASCRVGGSNPTIDGWERSFDAIVANGSLEHFVQASDAAAGRGDAIYEELFAICRRLLAEGGRLVTTAIHFRVPGQFDPQRILQGPYAHPRASANYQFALLVKQFGGWYPEPGQLQRCAGDSFELIDEEDGTLDYHYTSEYWLRRFKRMLMWNPRVWWCVARQWWQRAGAGAQTLLF